MDELGLVFIMGSLSECIQLYDSSLLKVKDIFIRKEAQSSDSLQIVDFCFSEKHLRVVWVSHS